MNQHAEAGHPLISVVIPTHGRRELLQQLLTALGAQDLPAEDFEVVVVVDGSADGTWEAVRAMEVPYTLRVLQEEQAGPSVARNYGARSAHGDVLVFLDDDMLPMPGLLAAHWRVHRQDPTALVLGQYLPAGDSYTNGKGGWHIWEERVLRKHYAAVSNGTRPAAGRRLYSGNFSVRRDHFLRVGGFDERLKRQEDVELGLRLERAGLRYYYRSDAGAVHRGYRSFDSWLRSAHAQGKYDVLFATEQGLGELSEVLGWYGRQRAAIGSVVRLTMAWPRVRLPTVLALRGGGACLTRFRLYALAHPCYSAIYKIQYWHGVADATGGQRAFLQQYAAACHYEP